MADHNALKEWLGAARPKTLTASLVPILVGTSLVHASEYKVYWWITLLALLSSTSIQIGTNLVNDAVDFKRGADNQNRIGPRRVTQSGVFSYKQVMIAASFCFLLAVVFGAPLVWHGGMPIVVIGITSIFCGYLYTSGKFALAYTGIADLFVILFFGLVAVGGIFFLHTKTYAESAFLAGLQVGLLATVLLAVNNLRDIVGDAGAGKKTLAVRLGKRFARAQIMFMSLLPFVINFYWAKKSYCLAGLLPFMSLPLAIYLTKNVYNNEPGPIFNRFLAKAALLHLLFGVFLSAGLLIK